MADTFLPFSKPSINSDDIAAVNEVLRSGWITTGSKSAEFEKKFCEYIGSPNAVALTSATAGMHLVLKAFGIGKGDEVITPSMTWVSTINLITMAGATPVFADIDKDTLMMNRESVEKCLSEEVKMIIPVHFAGAPAQLDSLQKIAKKYTITLVEDAAHALGTRYKGIKIGSQGTGIFSFHPIKNITTGEGGMLCSDDDTLIEKIQRLKFHGLGMDSFDRISHGRLPQAEVLEPGYKYNFPDILAALGISQLKRINEFNKKREALAMKYLELLNDVEEIIPLKPPGPEIKHSWHLFIVRLDIEKAGMSRDQFMEDLKKNNIGTGLHFKAVHLHQYYKKNLNITPGSLVNTEWNSKRILSLPLFPDMTQKDVLRVVTVIKKVLKK
ncbi:MAG: aminotransferase class I/II-fold pyridoxal phosphate-dependent enzyme [Desulfobacula sp.]|jgi:UDP-4-amino-4-deoxy-L-arabinose-oxoglutarate aminotransferase|nr:aminotransferase class I/II-fold pyridoxal phosphate-dependent enzyme [Desulfobacula sp.]